MQAPPRAVEPAPDSGAGARRHARTLAIVLAAAVGLAVAWAAVAISSRATEIGPLAQAPLRFPSVACGASIELYRERALEAAGRARAQIERYRFAPEVGLPAAALLSEAAQCALRAGDAALADRDEHALEQLRLRLERDYDDHFARLRWALATKRDAFARNEAGFLRALVGPSAPRLSERLQAIELGLGRTVEEGSP